jgi:hypothetical protein
VDNVLGLPSRVKVGRTTPGCKAQRRYATTVPALSAIYQRLPHHNRQINREMQEAKDLKTRKIYRSGMRGSYPLRPGFPGGAGVGRPRMRLPRGGNKTHPA